MYEEEEQCKELRATLSGVTRVGNAGARPGDAAAPEEAPDSTPKPPLLLAPAPFERERMPREGLLADP